MSEPKQRSAASADKAMRRGEARLRHDAQRPTRGDPASLIVASQRECGRNACCRRWATASSWRSTPSA